VLKVLHKGGSSFGQAHIGQSRPVCHFTNFVMDTEKNGESQPDSLLSRNQTRLPSARWVPHSCPVCPTAPVELPGPIEFQPSAGDAQVILDSGAVWMDTDGLERRTLTLPKVLTNRQHWITSETRRNMEWACGQAGNLKCRQWGRRFFTAQRLRVHVLEHYTNILCSCREYSF